MRLNAKATGGGRPSSVAVIAQAAKKKNFLFFCGSCLPRSFGQPRRSPWSSATTLHNRDRRGRGLDEKMARFDSSANKAFMQTRHRGAVGRVQMEHAPRVPRALHGSPNGMVKPAGLIAVVASW